MLTALIIIVFVIILIVGFKKIREEKAAAAERERRRIRAEQLAREQEEARQAKIRARQHQDFKDEVSMHLHKIEKKVQPGYNDPEEDYKRLQSLKNKGVSNGWDKDYVDLTLRHCVNLRKKLIAGAAKGAGITGLCEALSAASCLKHVEPKKERPTQAAENLMQTIVVSFSTAGYLDYGDYDDYGRCTFPLDNPDEMNKLTEKADSIMARLEESENALGNMDSTNVYDRVLSHINPQLVTDACMMMWYYAKKWPFDAPAFEKARKTYLSHTAYHLDDDKGELLEIGPVEEVLARVYAKNKIGGIGTAKQEKAYIDLWLEKKLELEDYDPCYALAHGLAWMELYGIEIDVLRRLIQSGADVPPQLQDRLTFLELGGNADIKIYDIEPFDNIFFFVTSPIERSNKDLATFFRKVAMKRTRFKYSLALAKWSKSLPLASGQKVSYEALNKALVSLVDDFDGEVTCVIRNAATVNLGHAAFINCPLYSFHSHRNRCLDILFCCEKFGRNLNLTIYTLFTPNDKLEVEDMEQTCLAIKENMYVESFRESILQVVDESIKVKQSVYEDDDTPRKKMVFDDEE